jgi:hypothetical protein
VASTGESYLRDWLPYLSGGAAAIIGSLYLLQVSIPYINHNHIMYYKILSTIQRVIYYKVYLNIFTNFKTISVKKINIFSIDQ